MTVYLQQFLRVVRGRYLMAVHHHILVQIGVVGTVETFEFLHGAPIRRNLL